jgi:hypothetical protein
MRPVHAVANIPAYLAKATGIPAFPVIPGGATNCFPGR